MKNMITTGKNLRQQRLVNYCEKRISMDDISEGLKYFHTTENELNTNNIARFKEKYKYLFENYIYEDIAYTCFNISESISGTENLEAHVYSRYLAELPMSNHKNLLPAVCEHWTQDMHPNETFLVAPKEFLMDTDPSIIHWQDKDGYVAAGYIFTPLQSSTIIVLGVDKEITNTVDIVNTNFYNNKYDIFTPYLVKLTL